MKKILILVSLISFTISLKAQTPETKMWDAELLPLINVKELVSGLQNQTKSKYEFRAGCTRSN